MASWVVESPFAGVSSDVDRRKLAEEATTYRMAHGIVMGGKGPHEGYTVPAPVTLFPSLFPLDQFELGMQIQPLVSELVHRVSTHPTFLEETLGGAAAVDAEFTGEMLRVHRTVQREGITQPLMLGLHRTDYMLHVQEDGSTQIKMVEINTIAASFGGLGSRAAPLFRFLVDDNDLLAGDKQQEGEQRPFVPDNQALQGLARAMATACTAYDPKADRAVVLMVVQPGEKNAYDQALLIHQLRIAHSRKVVRASLADIARYGRVDEESSERKLMFNGYEVALVYFRAGYAPTDYPTGPGGVEWSARLLLERSRAIKCPSIQYHLAGAKKVQQVMAAPGVLERFFPESSDAVSLLRSTFAGLYSLDEGSEGDAAAAEGSRRPAAFVLKPQREGGGNNLYGDAIPAALGKMSAHERSAYILMERLYPPAVPNCIVGRDGVLGEGLMVSEFGTFGAFLGGRPDQEPLLNEALGYLLRSKMATALDGGVAAGVAVLDSPLLTRTFQPHAAVAEDA